MTDSVYAIVEPTLPAPMIVILFIKITPSFVIRLIFLQNALFCNNQFYISLINKDMNDLKKQAFSTVAALFSPSNFCVWKKLGGAEKPDRPASFFARVSP